MVTIPQWNEFTHVVNGQEKVDFKALRTCLKTCSIKIKSSELCSEAIAHFNLFHGDTDKCRYISFFFNNGTHRFQINYRRSAITPELLTAIVEFSNFYNFNLYMSEFCYITGKNRREDNVCSTSVITLDLDKKEVDIHKELPIIQKICKDNGLKLAAVLSSGRGHYLVFKLDTPFVCSNNSLYLNRWKWSYDRFCDLFQDYEADYKCKDICRVFRLMGTYNHKDKRKYETKILYQWNETNHFVDVPIYKKTIDDKMFEPATLAALACDNISRKRKKKTDTISNTNFLVKKEKENFKAQNKKRLNDLVHLIVIRDEHLGDRHAFLYTIINQLNAAGYTYQEALDYLLTKVNPRFSLPESEDEIIRQLQYIYKHNKAHEEFDGFKNVEYVDNIYHCLTTQSIISLLKITEKEQTQLKVLKSQEMFKQLRQEKRLTRLRCRTQNKKEKEHHEINQMANDYSIGQIMEEKALAQSSVYKKLDKTPKQIQMEKENSQIIKLYQKGLSISKIAEVVGLSYDTTKKRLQKIKSQKTENVIEAVQENVVIETENTISSFADFLLQNNVETTIEDNLQLHEYLDTSPPQNQQKSI